MSVLNQQITNFVTEAAASQKRPNVLVGFANASEIVAASRLNIPYGNAVSIVTALDPHVVAGLENGPTSEYYNETEFCKELIKGLEGRVADFLTQKGFGAMRLVDAQLDMIAHGTPREDAISLSHRMIAAHAGLGWIGKSGLVVTKYYGPAVSLGCVLTDAPVECGKEVFMSRCVRCVECVVACPAAAIGNNEWDGEIGISKLIDKERCAEECRSQSLANLGFETNLCGHCVLACPYTRSYLNRNGLTHVEV